MAPRPTGHSQPLSIAWCHSKSLPLVVAITRTPARSVPQTSRTVGVRIAWCYSCGRGPLYVLFRHVACRVRRAVAVHEGPVSLHAPASSAGLLARTDAIHAILPSRRIQRQWQAWRWYHHRQDRAYCCCRKRQVRKHCYWVVPHRCCSGAKAGLRPTSSATLCGLAKGPPATFLAAQLLRQSLQPKCVTIAVRIRASIVTQDTCSNPTMQ